MVITCLELILLIKHGNPKINIAFQTPTIKISNVFINHLKFTIPNYMTICNKYTLQIKWQLNINTFYVRNMMRLIYVKILEHR
ncbi:hypothetical protein Hanom_Chr05g00403071 [Helianthus anomalus]